jgi:hypothetical protein
MKYSLRSLMTFSIRDLLWLTVVVAVFGAWYVDRQNLWSQNERIEMKARADEMKHATQLDLMERYLRKVQASYEADSTMPTSRAPAPNPPKP